MDCKRFIQIVTLRNDLLEASRRTMKIKVRNEMKTNNNFFRLNISSILKKPFFDPIFRFIGVLVSINLDEPTPVRPSRNKTSFLFYFIRNEHET